MFKTPLFLVQPIAKYSLPVMGLYLATFSVIESMATSLGYSCWSASAIFL